MTLKLNIKNNNTKIKYKNNFQKTLKDLTRINKYKKK